MVIAQKTEKLMQACDKSVKDFKFQLDMFHGDELANFQEDFKLLKEKQGECRQVYFFMEEHVNQFKTTGAIGNISNNNSAVMSDDYIRDRHIDNIDRLRDTDGKLAEIMQLGHEAVQNTRQVAHGLHEQSQIIHQFYYYD